MAVLTHASCLDRAISSTSLRRQREVSDALAASLTSTARISCDDMTSLQFLRSHSLFCVWVATRSTREPDSTHPFMQILTQNTQALTTATAKPRAVEIAADVDKFPGCGVLPSSLPSFLSAGDEDLGLAEGSLGEGAVVLPILSVCVGVGVVVTLGPTVVGSFDGGLDAPIFVGGDVS